MSDWSKLYPPERRPSAEELRTQAATPLWQELCGYLESAYAVTPRTEYSRCGSLPGWNVKYKKAGKALCTLYPGWPAPGSFTCMVVAREKDEQEVALALAGCTPAVQQLFETTAYFNGGKWLMIRVDSPDALRDVKVLLAVRARPAAATL